MATKFKVGELKSFFKNMAEIEKRIEEIAPLCTDITSSEDITGFSYDDDGSICIRVYSSDCGNDAYWFPLDYLTMDVAEILNAEKKKAEKAKRALAREMRKEKKAKEKAERKEYERLKKKYEGS